MMNTRVIKNYDPTTLTYDFLYNTNDWDLIELNYNLDIVALENWWAEVKIKFDHMKFDFNKNSNLIELEKSIKMVEEGYCGYYCGPITGITMAWPEEKYEPLPPPAQANLEIFKEVNRDTFYDDAKLMPKFKFGYFEQMVNVLGVDSFRQAIITTHYPGMYIRQHIDSKVLKMHVPVETNKNAVFHFGENKERSYHMQLGKAYILNTGDWHGTTNESEFERSHIITRVAPDQLFKIVGLSNKESNAIN